MATLKRIEVTNGQLTIENEGVTTRMAAGSLTERLVPLMSRQLLTADEQAVLDMLGLPYVSLTIRERADVPGDEDLWQVQDGEAEEGV
jgi:hypothetical protein